MISEAVEESVSVVIDEENGTILELPERKARLSVVIKSTPVSDIDKIEVNNDRDLSGNRQAAARKVRGLAHSAELWTRSVDSDICLLAANIMWTVVASFNGKILVLSTSTGSVCDNFIVESTPCSMVLREFYLCVITSRGYINIRDIERRKAILVQESLSEILTPDDSITRHVIAPSGVPVLCLSSGNVYSFVSGGWELSGNRKSVLPRFAYPILRPAVVQQSELFGFLDTSISEPLPADEPFRLNVTYSLLEAKLRAAFIWQCEVEYRAFLDVYVRWLIEKGGFDLLNCFVDSVKREQTWFGKLSVQEVLKVVESLQRHYDADGSHQLSSICLDH